MLSVNDPAIVAQWAAMVPMGRIGKPHDIAEAAAYLASDAAAYVTGTEVLIDGGFNA
jgi:NAD(P)-dependent dehydrogenase (short-subunit alcohol dehydrogenase family)